MNHVSQLLQSPITQLDVLFDLLTKAKTSQINYRDTGFASATASANNMYEVKWKWNECGGCVKRKQTKKHKQHLSYKTPEESFAEPWRGFKQHSLAMLLVCVGVQYRKKQNN